MTGTRRGPEPDRVLATVLFTDIVGSTERAARAGDYRWRDLLDRHNALVRRELGHFRGREVVTTGDGFLATFDGPARAIRCARQVADTAPGPGLELRSGLHTGRSSSPERTSAASRSISAPGSCQWPGCVRCWCPPP